MYYHVEECKQFINGKLLRSGNLLEAGLCSGKTAGILADLADQAGNPFKEIWGFDSFTGLPPETEGIWHNPDWFVGQYSALQYFNLASVDEAVTHAKRNISNRSNVYIVPGFFDETLTDNLGKQLVGTASFVNIDCNLHSSTMCFMDWLLWYRIMREGCIVRFDDWLGTKYCEYHHAGENLAFEQITSTYSIQWDKVDDSENVFIYRGHKCDN